MKSKITLLLAGAMSLSAVSAFAQKNCVIEEFTSSTCPPCKSFAAWFDPAMTTNNANKPSSGNVLIKYQMNWPPPGNDVSYNQHGLDRRTFYNVTGIPHHFANGTDGTASDAASLSTEITNCKKTTTNMNITATYKIKKIDATNDSIFITVKCTPTVALSGTYKVLIAATEIYYQNSGNTTGQLDYYHVMRKMFPSGNGTTVSTWVANTPQTFTFADKITIGTVTQMSNLWWGNPYNGNLIVMVQDANTKAMLEAIAQPAQWNTSVSELANNVANVAIVPNPATDKAAVFFTLNEGGKVLVNVTDAMGRVVYTDAAVYATGSNRALISTESLPAGTYNVTLITDQGRTSERLAVVK